MTTATRSRFVRLARLAAAAPALLFLWACNDRSLATPEGEPEQIDIQYFDQTQTKSADILFLIDDSSSMKSFQEGIAGKFHEFMNVLKTIPGGQPDLHIGVVSSSLGAGASSGVFGCPAGGLRGAFQNAPRGGGGICKTVPHDRYIISLEKGTKNNFDGDISDVFACIAELGDGGCGFEHQLAAVSRALGLSVGGWKNGAPAENTGFLREEAHLAIVLITNEDDCSAPIDSDLFSPSDTMGPVRNFRCAEYGILCGGVRPPRSDASLADCHDAGPAGKLIPVADFVGAIKSLKRNPNKIIVSAIAGDPQPVRVKVADGKPDLEHSCTHATGFGDPGVRIKEFVDAFGANGTFSTICAGDFTPALQRTADLLTTRFKRMCLGGVLRDADPDTEGLQVDCSVVEETYGFPARPMPSCDVGGGTPCWDLESNPADCPASGWELKIDRGHEVEAPPDTTAVVRCATCTNPNDPRCRGR